MRVFIGTVGYHILGNHSIGPVLLPKIRQLSLPDYVTIDELNWGPIAVVQQFQAEESPYDRVVLLCAIERPERSIGDITIFRWQGGLPDEEQIQACIGDAATGVISVENLLVIGEYFKIWGEEVFLVDVEPGEEIAGETLTKEVVRKIPQVCSLLSRLALEGAAIDEKMEYLYGKTLFTEKTTAHER